jgi:hypothetical protein
LFEEANNYKMTILLFVTTVTLYILKLSDIVLKKTN